MIVIDTFNLLILVLVIFTIATFAFFHLYQTSGKKTYADTICGVFSIIISAFLAVGQGAGTFKSEVLNIVVQDNGLAYLFGCWALLMIIMTILFFVKEISDSQSGGV